MNVIIKDETWEEVCDEGRKVTVHYGNNSSGNEDGILEPCSWYQNRTEVKQICAGGMINRVEITHTF